MESTEETIRRKSACSPSALHTLVFQLPGSVLGANFSSGMDLCCLSSATRVVFMRSPVTASALI